MPLWAYSDGTAVVHRTLTDTKDGFTTGSVNLGTPTWDRVIVVAAVFAGIAASGVTLGGNAMTSVASPGGASGTVAIYALAFPSGTSDTLTLTGAGAITSVAVYALIGLSGNAAAFASNSASTNSTSLNVRANGACIGVGYSNNASTGYTFSGIADDHNYNSGSSGGGMASQEFSTAQTPLSVSFSSSGATFRIAAGSW